MGRLPTAASDDADRAAAEKKVEMWSKRAASAREQGRAADAARCDDKVRDWASRVREITRRQVRRVSRNHPAVSTTDKRS